MTSIILPTYNRAHLLPTAIKSAQGSAKDIEIIVVDDGSTDNTPSVCANYKDLRVIRLPKNRGLANARNTGILAATGDLIAFLDDDDRRFPNSIDLQSEILTKDPTAALIYGKITCLPNHSEWPIQCHSGDIFWKLIECNFIPVTAVLVRKQALLDAGLFDSNLRVAEDWDVWLRIAANHRILAMEEPVAYYQTANLLSGQLSSNCVTMSRTCARVQARALSSVRGLAGGTALRKKLRHRHLLRSWSELTLASTQYLLARDRKNAAHCLLNAFCMMPNYSFRSNQFIRLVKLVITSENHSETKNTRKEIFSLVKILDEEAGC